jgi:hypothetical protein
MIRVVAADVGGGCAKASLYPGEIAVCVMARRSGPVMDRRPARGSAATSQAWDDRRGGWAAADARSRPRAEVMADVSAY